MGNALRAFGATLSTLGGLNELMGQIQAERVNRSRVQALQDASAGGEEPATGGMSLGDLGRPPQPSPMAQPDSGGDALAVSPTEGSPETPQPPQPPSVSSPAKMSVPKRPLAPWEVYRIAAARQLKLGDIAGAELFSDKADKAHKNALETQGKALANQEIESKMLSGAAATIKSSITDPAMRQDAYQRLKTNIQNGPLGGLLAGLPDQVSDDVLDAIIAMPETTGERLQQQRDVISRATEALNKLGIVTIDPQTHKPIWDVKFKEGQDADAAKMMATSTDDDSWQAHLDWVKRNLHAADVSRFAAAYSPKAVKDALAMSVGPEKMVGFTGTLPSGEQTEAAANRAAQLAVSQQNAATAEKRLQLSGDSGADPEAVAGYVRQVKSGILPLTNVPAGTRNAVVKALEHEGVDIQKLTAADLTRKNVAKTIIPKIAEAKSLAQEIDAMGLTGSIGGRWRKLISGETAASDLSGLTSEQKQKVGKFVAIASGLLVSGIAMAHGGARGGGSPQLLEQIKKYLDPANKDLDIYLGNLDGALDFMQGYANMGEAKTPTSGEPGGGKVEEWVIDPKTGKLVRKGGG